MKDNNKIRIQKLISQSGVASRRKAEELILEGKVFINGKKAKIGVSASFDDKIIVNGKLIKKQDNYYFLLNKPQNYLSTVTDDRQRPTVVDLIDTDEYIYPVGRLDIDTTGVLLLTNDGELTNRLLHPSRKIKRIYYAELSSQLTFEQLKLLNSNRVILDSGKSRQLVKHLYDNVYNQYS
jgi:23S rRNA pseudouridine2605 synthase